MPYRMSHTSISPRTYQESPLKDTVLFNIKNGGTPSDHNISNPPTPTTSVQTKRTLLNTIMKFLSLF